MQFTKSKSEPEPFRVPSLAEADQQYAALTTKRIELSDRQAVLVAERRQLEKAIAADTSREVPGRVAELLGDEPGTKALNRNRVSEIRAELANIEAAIGVIDQRLRDAKARASLAVCALVRPEYARRVKALVDAMRQLDDAHRHFDELRFQLEADDVEWTRLGVMTPRFLGLSGEADRHITRYIRDAKEAGYVD